MAIASLMRKERGSKIEPTRTEQKITRFRELPDPSDGFFYEETQPVYEFNRYDWQGHNWSPVRYAAHMWGTQACWEAQRNGVNFTARMACLYKVTVLWGC